MEEPNESPVQIKRLVIGAGVVSGVAVLAYVGKKALDRYNDWRYEVLFPERDSDNTAPKPSAVVTSDRDEILRQSSEIMDKILRAKQQIELNSLRQNVLDELQSEEPDLTGTGWEVVAEDTEKKMVNEILGMTELELDKAILRGFNESPVEINHLVTGVTVTPFDLEWDWDEAKVNREGKLIYLLHETEFFQNERDFTQDTLTYYVGDHTLADQNDRPIYNVTEVLGNDFLDNFGRGTSAEDVQYLRNEYLKAEYEVIRAQQSYAETVLGVDQTMEDYPVKKNARRVMRDWDEE